MVKQLTNKSFLFVVLICLSVFSSGCSGVYYKTMETFGKHKRDILVDRVSSARDTQESAKQEFQTALEKFTSVVNVPPSELQNKYNQLKSELDRSEAKAKAVHTRIVEVEDVGNALFSEWKSELKQYTSQDMRFASEQKLIQTRLRYDKLIGAMKQAEQRITPILSAFRDQVLFLKHNLNAQAVASMQGELISIESNVALLVKEMNASIAEADAFIKSMASE